MCGIAGFSSTSNHLQPDFYSVLQNLAHRGPDDGGLFVEQSAGVSLAHTRLSIQDLSPLGHQPMVSNDGSVVIVFNGEIYNFHEIRIELVASGFAFKGLSDTEVLLNLYLSEGAAMLSRLKGIFSFAIWDSRKQHLFLARDAIGVKPLYYAMQDDCFIFASEIKALIPLLSNLGELDEDAIHRYLTFLWCPGEGTLMRSVRKLLPGEAMIVRTGTIERRWVWYQLPKFGAIQAVNTKLNDVIKQSQNHLRNAVQRQMIADVPVGAFLSGGLDSSAIVAFARDINPDIRCFTIKMTGGQDQGAVDDLPYAQKVAKHLHVPLDVVEIDSSRMAQDIEMMIYQLDEPLADPAPLNVFYISQLAREQGIKVLLSGAGGDDLFTGYRRHYAMQLERWWSWLPKSVRKQMDQWSQNLDQRKAINRKFSKLMVGADLDGDERLINYFRWIQPQQLQSLYSDEFRVAIGDSDAAEPMLDFLRHLPDDTDRLERMLALEQRFFLTDHNLTYTDKMSMAVGVEVRVPFLDLEMVDFAATIPTRYKQHGREGKWILKKAMESYLPHDVIYRSKTGFGAPLRRWMRYELRELLGDMLSESCIRKRGLFNPIAVQQLISDNDAGRIDASYTLLSLLSIEIWCRRFIDSKCQ